MERVKGFESLILLPDYAYLRSYKQLNAVYIFDTWAQMGAKRQKPCH